MLFCHQEARLGTNPESLDSLRPSSVALAFRSFGALIERESEGWSRLEAGRPARQNGVREGGDEDACARAPKPKPILPLAPMLMNLPSNQPPILGGRDIPLVAHHAWDGTLFYALLFCNNGMGSIRSGCSKQPCSAACITEKKIEMATLVQYTNTSYRFTLIFSMRYP